jgi:hypothetical protein
VKKILSCIAATAVTLTLSLAVYAAEEGTAKSDGSALTKFKNGKNTKKKFKQCGTQCNCDRKGNKPADKEGNKVVTPGTATVPGDK